MTVSLQIFHRKKIQINSHIWPMIKHYHFIWRQRCCEVFEWFNLKSNFIPAVVGVFSRDLIILLENPPIFGAASQWSGEIAIFHPHIARNCYISPSYWFSGKRFCGVRIIGIGEPIMSAQEGGMMMGLLKWTWELISWLPVAWIVHTSTYWNEVYTLNAKDAKDHKQNKKCLSATITN